MENCIQKHASFTLNLSADCWSEWFSLEHDLSFQQQTYQYDIMLKMTRSWITLSQQDILSSHIQKEVYIFSEKRIWHALNMSFVNLLRPCLSTFRVCNAPSSFSHYLSIITVSWNNKDSKKRIINSCVVSYIQVKLVIYWKKDLYVLILLLYCNNP